jgi:hypothetical protein
MWEQGDRMSLREKSAQNENHFVSKLISNFYVLCKNLVTLEQRQVSR